LYHSYQPTPPKEGNPTPNKRNKSTKRNQTLNQHVTIETKRFNTPHKQNKDHQSIKHNLTSPTDNTPPIQIAQQKIKFCLPKIETDNLNRIQTR